MEINYIVLYCVFFTTVAFISSINALPEYANEDLALDSLETDCHCENGRCITNKEGHTKCACKPGFALQDEITCKPCDCGSLGKFLFVLKSTGEDQYQYQKKCVCDVGYADKDGVCVTCDCGENSVCDFDHGKRRCYCIEGYAEKDGVCQTCDCGPNSEDCGFLLAEKQCKCKDGYADRSGTCEVGCSVKLPCQNGGYCKDTFCICIEGTKGEFCEVIDECSNLCPNRSDVKCSYDIQSKKAYCKCLDSDLSYDSKMRQCRKTCGTNYQCINGQCRNNVCDCIPGTSGDQCEIVDCTTDAINCQNGMTFLRRGQETIFVLHQGKLRKFERQGTVFMYTNCSFLRTVACSNPHKFFWCADGRKVYVPTRPKNLLGFVQRFDIKNSDGARCSRH